MIKRMIFRDFFINSILPVLLAWILYNMFNHICVIDGKMDYFRLWILCGIPFGIGKMFMLQIGGDLGRGIAVFLMNFVVGGLIGGVILCWRLSKAVYYVPYTIVRLIAAHNTRLYE